MIRFGLRHQPILLAAAALGMLVGGLLRLFGLSWPSAVLFGWCAAVVAHAGPTFVAMQRATPDLIRRRAEALDEGEAAILAATLVAAIASLGAVFWYLASGEGPTTPRQVVLALVTIGLSWLFVHMLFAVRYAHEYWQAGGGLDFPGDETPEFNDFLYYAFTIGMTFQTSDVTVRHRLLRQLTLIHALVSFLFNAVILAVAVNLAASLAG